MHWRYKINLAGRRVSRVGRIFFARVVGLFSSAVPERPAAGLSAGRLVQLAVAHGVGHPDRLAVRPCAERFVQLALAHDVGSPAPLAAAPSAERLARPAAGPGVEFPELLAAVPCVERLDGHLGWPSHGLVPLLMRDLSPRRLAPWQHHERER